MGLGSSGENSLQGEDMCIRFVVAFVSFYVGHMAADYWIQTDWQARTKGQPGSIGRVACLRHVATYTATLAIIVVLVSYRIDVDLSAVRMAVALAVLAVTHYVADRRVPLRRLAVLLRHGGAWLDSGGLALLDQAWHVWWVGVASLIV